jgi:hypothetical protein
MEQTTLKAIIVLQSLSKLTIQLAGIGSAAIMFMSAFPLFLVLVENRLLTGHGSGKANRKKKSVSLWVYALGQCFLLLGGTMLLVPVVEFFVPLVRFFPPLFNQNTTPHLVIDRPNWRGSS